ncbi:MAG TPA: PIN domain-containing protein [Bryobacteraceae bacterium]|jgi:predicted nucleic acid-binding protein|nr:PIN domain-containing protein [Bryobacteraceae bacterium]
MILIDSGPLVALVDADDQYHAACSTAFRTLRRQRMATVWPVLTEAMHFLDDLPKAQDNVWEMVVRGVVDVLPLGLDDVPRIRELMRQYANRPMDLADAALIRVAEREGIRQFFTIDRKDFAVYRLHGKIRPTIIP